jgi:putative ABC transport system substrate-binding protein
MRRREFLGVMGGVAAAWPIAAASQTAAPRIGVLFAGSEGSLESKASLAEISEGLRDVGLIEGRDYVLEWRFAAGSQIRRGPKWR